MEKRDEIKKVIEDAVRKRQPVIQFPFEMTSEQFEYAMQVMNEHAVVERSRKMSREEALHWHAYFNIPGEIRDFYSTIDDVNAFEEPTVEVRIDDLDAYERRITGRREATYGRRPPVGRDISDRVETKPQPVKGLLPRFAASLKEKVKSLIQ